MRTRMLTPKLTCTRTRLARLGSARRSFVTFACFGLWYNVRSETVPSIPRLPNFRSKAFEIPNVPLEPNPDAEDEIHERNCLNLLTMNVDVYLQQHGSSRDFVDEEDADNDNTKMGKRKRSN